VNTGASPQRLDRTLVCCRIGDPNGDFPVYDARGSALYPGRWNDRDTPVIYAGEHYSTAMLEKLAQGNKELPPNQHYIAITIPRGTTFETVTRDHLPGWDTPEPLASRTHGSLWVRYCCKSRFAQVIKNSAGCRRVFGVKMWGDMSPRVKLTGDFGNAIEGIRISNRLPPLVFAKNSWRCNFRLLQQYPPKATLDVNGDGLKVR
jgi:RES domain-containing protein